jgi:ABC-2 type transport system permease protein
MIFTGFYASSKAQQPISHADAITYIWLGQAFLAMFPWNVDADFRLMIRSGNVAHELLRPLDLYGFWFSRVLAFRTAPVLLRAVPMFIVAGLFFGMHLPPTITSLGLWVVSMIGMLALSCAITTLLTLSLLWTISGDGVIRVAPAIVTLFSGMLTPIPLMPKWAQPIVYALPFRGVCDTPFRIYTGNMGPAEALPGIAQQFVWALVLVAVGRLILARGVRRLVVQGG